MTKNMSKTDGAIRIVLALVIAALWYFNVLSGLWLTILGLVAVIFIATGFLNFCPLYTVLKIKTRKANPTA
jgi:glucan phosphoethanolaminetransferase (alkaline phosphatase superfamily)